MWESRRLSGTVRSCFMPGFPLELPLEHGKRIHSLDGQPAGWTLAMDITTW